MADDAAVATTNEQLARKLERQLEEAMKEVEQLHSGPSTGSAPPAASSSRPRAVSVDLVDLQQEAADCAVEFDDGGLVWDVDATTQGTEGAGGSEEAGEETAVDESERLAQMEAACSIL